MFIIDSCGKGRNVSKEQIAILLKFEPVKCKHLTSSSVNT